MSRELHFTIGTAGSLVDSSEQPSLTTDLLLVKAGLLYADRVCLYSIGSSLGARLLTLGDATRDEKLQWLERFFRNQSATWPRATGGGLDMVMRYRQLLRKQSIKQLSVGERLEMRHKRNALNGVWREYERQMGDFARSAGAQGIVEARDSGILDLHQFGTGKLETLTELTPDNTTEKQELFDELTLEFFDLIAKATADGSTYPLFDDISGDLLRAGTDLGAVVISESSVARGRHSGLASELLRRLPLFEMATVNQILDIRRELASPLVRFRAAVVGFSEKIRSAAWDSDFASDAEMVFRKQVEPAVLELEEEVQSSSDLGELALRTFRPGDVAMGLGVMLSSLTHLPALAAVALGSGVTATMTGRKAYEEWRAGRKTLEHNQMYFYFRSGERLRGF
jgi:hypothetical protein